MRTAISPRLAIRTEEVMSEQENGDYEPLPHRVAAFVPARTPQRNAGAFVVVGAAGAADTDGGGPIG
jgi:hypothetical protein